MDTTLLRLTTRRGLIGTLVGTALLFVSAGTASAQAGAPLVGVWLATIQPRDCTTSTPLGPPIRALYTYHQDGTALESNGALAFKPGQRSAGHGTWSHGVGATFAERTIGLVLFETQPNDPPGSPGFLAGWQVINSTITMTDADHFTAAGDSLFFDVNGQLYRTSCATRVAERLR